MLGLAGAGLAVWLAIPTHAGTPATGPVTGPVRGVICDPDGEVSFEARDALLRAAEAARLQPPWAVEVMHSAGASQIDEAVLDTRRAFSDADATRTLALAWAWTGREVYARAAADRLVHWAETYVPTGHPINETRLEGLVMAYSIVHDQLGEAEALQVRAFLQALREAKAAWTFGPVTAVNNHRTHQLKMLRWLDEVLGSTDKTDERRAQERAHLEQNLDPVTGVSRDLLERDALYYHVYTLEPWLEIAWLEGSVDPAVEAAVRYLIDRLEAGELGGEFEDSSSPLDAARAGAGFGYGRGGSEFEPRRARRVLWTYEAVTGRLLPAAVSAQIAGGPDPHELFYWLRRERCLPRR